MATDIVPYLSRLHVKHEVTKVDYKPPNNELLSPLFSPITWYHPLIRVRVQCLDKLRGLRSRRRAHVQHLSV